MTKRKTKTSQDHWRKCREEQSQRADAERLDELEQHYLDHERAIGPLTAEDAASWDDLFKQEETNDQQRR